MQVHALIYRELEHYVARCLNVHVLSFGHTCDEALANLHGCLEAFLDDMPEALVLHIDRPTLRQISVSVPPRDRS